MAFVRINRNPTERQLRQFGATALAALPLAAWIAAGRPTSEWTAGQSTAVGALALVGLVGAVAAAVRPRLLRPVFLAASYATWPLGFFVGEVLLAVVYYAVFAPVGVAFRWLGRDALERRIDRDATTYWRPKRQPDDVARYLRQS